MTPMYAHNIETGESIYVEANEKKSLPGLGKTKMTGADNGGRVSFDLGDNGATINFGNKVGQIFLSPHAKPDLVLYDHQTVTVKPYTITATATPETLRNPLKWE